MHFSIIWALLVSLFCLAVYLWKTKDLVKPALIGFGCGLLVTLYIVGTHAWNL